MKRMKKFISMILCLAILAGYIPASVFAEDISQIGLCEHHEEHTGCSYAPAVQGADCGHQHTDDCYTTEKHCTHIHDGCGTEEVSCGHVCEEHVCVTKTVSCTHLHNAECGYVQAKDATVCTFECTVCSSADNKTVNSAAPEETEDSEETESSENTPEEESQDAVILETVEGTVPVLQSPGDTVELPFQINPLYEGLVDAEDLEKSLESVPSRPASRAVIQYLSEADAAVALRNDMVSRTQSISLYIRSSQSDGTALINNVMDQALVHTGNPVEGDYLRWHYGGRGGNYSINGSSGNYYYYTFNLQISYYTTASEEAQLDSAVDNLLNSLSLNGKSDYEKIKAIYDHITANITYDHDNLNNTQYKLKFSAYAALMNGTAVCQGYANLLYRLALETGVDCRFIGGTGNGGGHGWNIIKLNDLYYNADATWDAGVTRYRYFLRCTDNFGDHTRDPEFDTSAFHTAYPMSTTDYETIEAKPSTLEVHASDLKVNMAKDESTTIYLWTTGEYPDDDYSLLIGRSNDNINFSYGAKGSDGKRPLNITANKLGNTTITFFAEDATTGALIDSVEIQVRVADAELPDLYVSCSEVNLTMNQTESTTIYVWATGENLNYYHLSYNLNPDYLDCSFGEWGSDGKLPLNIMPKKIGDTTLTVSVVEKATETAVDSVDVKVHITKGEYSISYNANGGTGAPGTQTKQHGTPLTLSDMVPTREGYIFLGWSADPNAASASYGPGASYTDDIAVTLYAVWKAVTPITVSILDVELQAGDTLPATFDFTVPEGVNKEDIKLTFTVKDSAGNVITNTNTPGEYIITATPAEGENPLYNITVVDGKLIIVAVNDRIDFAGTTMNLGNELAITFYIKTADLNGSDYYARITKEYADGRGDVTVQIPYSDWIRNGTAYIGPRFNGVAAKEMTDNIYVQIFDGKGEAVSVLRTDSVREFAMRGLANASFSVEQKIMLVDMLNYGTEAQAYFKEYHIADLANSLLSEEQKTLATDAVTYSNKRDTSNAGDYYAGSTLTLENSILMTMYFKNITRNMHAVINFTDHYGRIKEIQVSGNEFKANGNYLGVVIDELVVADARQMVTVKLYDGETLLSTVSDSIESNAARNTAPLFEAIMKLADSAYRMFH